MQLQTDPFRDFDAIFNRLGARVAPGSLMPMDAFRRGNDVWVHIDLPGVKPEHLDISVERNVLTISAERDWQRQDGDRVYATERTRGTMRRQIQLGDGLDLDHLEADLHDGVLTLRVPVKETAKPRRITVAIAPNSPRPSKPPAPPRPDPSPPACRPSPCGGRHVRVSGTSDPGEGVVRPGTAPTREGLPSRAQTRVQGVTR